MLFLFFKQWRYNLYMKKALLNSFMNYQSKKKVKCDFTFFFIFKGVVAIKNGSTSMCSGNSKIKQSFLNLSLSSGGES